MIKDFIRGFSEVFLKGWIPSIFDISALMDIAIFVWLLITFTPAVCWSLTIPIAILHNFFMFQVIILGLSALLSVCGWEDLKTRTPKNGGIGRCFGGLITLALWGIVSALKYIVNTGRAANERDSKKKEREVRSKDIVDSLDQLGSSNKSMLEEEIDNLDKK